MDERKAMLYFDTETSGLDPKRHGILQIAWIIEVNGAVLDEYCCDMKLAPGLDMCMEALSVNNFTLERIAKGRDPFLVFERMWSVVKTAVGGKSPLVPCGHNVRFDVDMLYATAQRYNAGQWLNFGNNGFIALRKPVCTLAMCHYLDYRGALKLPDYKLKTVCNHFGIALDDAHDALNDLRATRQLFHDLEHEYSREFEIIH